MDVITIETTSLGERSSLVVDGSSAPPQSLSVAPSEMSAVRNHGPFSVSPAGDH